MTNNDRMDTGMRIDNGVTSRSERTLTLLYRSYSRGSARALSARVILLLLARRAARRATVALELCRESRSRLARLVPLAPQPPLLRTRTRTCSARRAGPAARATAALDATA